MSLRLSAYLKRSFTLDVYTEIYAQVEGAKELTAFTDEYDDAVAEVLDNVEDIKKKTGNSTL